MTHKGMLLAPLLLLVASAMQGATAFVEVPPSKRWASKSNTVKAPLDEVLPSPTAFTRQRILRAGFGDGGPKKKKDQKLKPKAQWDRYTDSLKKETPYRVAVKAVGKETDDWLEVGNVKSKGGEFTKAAVARQRALIAEHAKRLFPLQVSQKDTVEWAYKDKSTDEWVIVDKSALDDDDIPDALEKIIGFEGRPDPASGFYCMYNEGRLVNSDDDLSNPLTRPTKKLQ